MIDLYFAATPNGWKATIALEELGLPYVVRPVNIGAGEQFAADFLAIAPNNRIPAIVDHDPADGGGPLSVFESGAILLYLAQKAGRLMPRDVRGRTAVTEWVMWQMGGLGPMLGQNGHFRLYAPDRIPYAMDRYAKEADRLYGVLDRQLARTGAHVAGADYSIADIACFPWIITHKAQGIDMTRFPHVARWFATVRARPAVAAGTAVGRMSRPEEISDEAKRVMMGIERP
ncbi:glutathione S-transferase [Sphingomonas sp. Leaf412]|uniref:glutathione S-transferase N-terminal domain-containing protein n=1 Tax=Sphingomonas sp. Leaf412 TaxID=1736370 RepID=UPI0006F86BB0|nr:glutathione S-transferase N-terminal domain-containing protein [Sphingomonas sp. Leaf412]KQT31856.1 glutathione S-transferase [Sphingomonas sp. Leaf412]